MIKRHTGAMMSALLAILTLAGCTTTEQAIPPLTPNMTGISEGKARVVFLRQSSVFQAGKPVALEINGASVAKLRNREYTFFDMPAGEHYFVVSEFPHTGAFRSGLTFKERQIRFLLVRPDTRQDNRRSLFRDSRKFDLDSGQFDVQEIRQTEGETYRRAMHWREPLASVPKLQRKRS
jgi:hypothetical protein